MGGGARFYFFPFDSFPKGSNPSGCVQENVWQPTPGSASQGLSWLLRFPRRMLKTSHPTTLGGREEGPSAFLSSRVFPGNLQAAHGAKCPQGGAPTLTCWVPDPRLVGKYLLPQRLVVCSRQAKSLGGGRHRSKDGTGLSLILLVPALFSSRNDFSLVYLRNTTVTQGLGWKRKRCPAQCWSHWTSYHLSPQACVTVWAVSMILSALILACYCLHMCTSTLMGVGVIYRLCCVNVWVQESVCLFKNTFWRFLLHTCYGLACVPPK